MKITVIGTGYVGLVSGACLADAGNDVVCLDTNPLIIDDLIAGKIPIYEPGLEEIILRNVTAGRLKFTTDISLSVNHGTIQIIAVGTPPDDDGSADLCHVISAATNIGRYMDGFKLVVNKSTVPIGTAEMVFNVISKELQRRKISPMFDVVSNPEFLKEGSAINDFMYPDRIVIGAEEKNSIEIMTSLYAPFQRQSARIIITNKKSSEMIKYAANAMLATRISFMNELANLSEILNVDIEMVRQGIGSDTRIGFDFLYPGCGYGGSCFPKDVKALIKTAKDVACYDLKILGAVEKVNNNQKLILANKILKRFSNNIEGMHFAIWGLSFKPNTNDMREAPSINIINALIDAGATITAYDPVAMKEATEVFGHSSRINYANNAISTINKADALVICTEWKEFRSVDIINIAKKLKHKIIFDGRNIYDPILMGENGIEYYAIGR